MKTRPSISELILGKTSLIRPARFVFSNLWISIRKKRSRTGRVLAALATVIGLFLPYVPVSATTCPTSGNNVTIATNCTFDAGTYTFTGTLTISSGTTVIAASNVGNGQVILVADSITIDGTLDGAGRGYAANNGPGKGTTNFAGSGHGGNGGNYNGAGGGPTYGSVTQPVD